MPKSIPTNGQANWGTVLNSHLGQLMDPTYGGFNIVADVAARNTRFPAVADNEGATVYNKSTGTFQVLESGPYTGVRWTDLGRTMSGNAQTGAGTLTYGINNPSNPEASDHYEYLQSSDNNFETYVQKGDYIKPNNTTGNFLYLVGDKVAANRFKISIALDERDNRISNGPTWTLTAGSRNVTISVPDYVVAGDRLSVGNAGTWLIEKISSTLYRTTDNAPFSGTLTIEVLQRPITNFSQWEVVKATLNVQDQLLVNPNKTITLNNASIVNKPQLTNTTVYSSSSISSGNNFWGNSSIATAVATGSTPVLTVGFSAHARQVVGNGVDSSLSATRSEWAGITNLIGINSITTQDASKDTSSSGMTSFNSRAYINRGKVKNVIGIFLDRTSMVSAPVGEAQLPDTAWGIYQTNMVTGTAGNFAAKNFFQGNVLIKPIDTTLNFAVQYAEASESLAVVGNILATGTVTQNSDITLKKDIVKIDGALNKLSQIKGVTYKWKKPENHGDDETEQLGIIAQDVEKVFPQAVSTDPNGIKSVSYGDMVAPLIEAIKELKAEIDSLKAQLIK